MHIYIYVYAYKYLYVYVYTYIYTNTTRTRRKKQFFFLFGRFPNQKHAGRVPPNKVTHLEAPYTNSSWGVVFLRVLV